MPDNRNRLRDTRIPLIDASRKGLPVPMPISEALRGLTDQRILQNHPLELYARAFDRSGMIVGAFIDAGSESVVFSLNDRFVVKVTREGLYDDIGHRPFDAPVLGHGTFMAKDWEGIRTEVHYIVQPKLEMTATEEDSRSFGVHVDTLGYSFIDPGPQQIGYHLGEVMLVDLYSVRKENAM